MNAATTTKTMIPKTCAGTALERAALRWMNERGEDYDNGARGAYDDLCKGGCASGMVGHLIYYSDTLKFYAKHRREINALVGEMFEQDPEQGFAQHFGDKWDASDPLAMDTNNRNLLAWFGFERAADLVFARFENAEG